MLAFDSDWWYCKTCLVRYRGVSDLYEIEFERTIKDKTYILVLDIQGNRTIIKEKIDDDNNLGGYVYQEETLINVKPVLNGVTADNAENKIKTLLTFS